MTSSGAYLTLLRRADLALDHMCQQVGAGSELEAFAVEGIRREIKAVLYGPTQPRTYNRKGELEPGGPELYELWRRMVHRAKTPNPTTQRSAQ